MGIELEKRLRKLEKAQQAKMDSTVIDQEEMKKRDELRQLMSTPEGRRLVRKLAGNPLSGSGQLCWRESEHSLRR